MGHGNNLRIVLLNSFARFLYKEPDPPTINILTGALP